MGDEDKGDAGLALQGLQLRPHPLPQLCVQRRQRLVQEQDLRPWRQGTGKGHPLLLATRKLVRAAMFHSLKPDQSHHSGHACGNLGLLPSTRRAKPTFCATVRCGNRA